MNVVVLTSSRADYGIYLPLLKRLHQDSFFDLKLYVFGTHLSSLHGHTIDHIKSDAFPIHYQVENLIMGDSPEAIATSMGLTYLKFASIWAKEKNNIDLLICLGDRYEMFAAVMASIPFNIPIAHIHGGETTTGSIDTIFRHSLTLAATYHFTATEKSAKRVEQLIGHSNGIFNVGSLSLDNIHEIALLTPSEFYAIYGIDMTISTILVTFHPETISFEKNKKYIQTIVNILKTINKQIIITMPNADTANAPIRDELRRLASQQKTIFLVENFGTQGYFSCMTYCDWIMGNSSSGIIEAASFGKYVINLGNRQGGREQGDNVINCLISEEAIQQAIQDMYTRPPLSRKNIYGDGNTARKIIDILKNQQQ